MCYSKQIMVGLSSDSFWNSNKAKWNWEGNTEGTPWEKGFYFQAVYSISMGVKLSWLAWKIHSQSCLLKYTSEFILLTYAIGCVCVLNMIVLLHTCVSQRDSFRNRPLHYMTYVLGVKSSCLGLAPSMFTYQVNFLILLLKFNGSFLVIVRIICHMLVLFVL